MSTPVTKKSTTRAKKAVTRVPRAAAKAALAKATTTTSVEVKAAARFVRMSPKKVRLIIDQIRGKSVVAADHYLQFVQRTAAQPVSKLLKSAVANAEHNFNLDTKDLVVKQVTANEGPIIKRYRPRAFGRAGMIRKRTTHIEMTLTSTTGAKSATVKKPKAAPEQAKPVAADKVEKGEKKEKTTSDIATSRASSAKVSGSNDKGFLKKVFNRKTG